MWGGDVIGLDGMGTGWGWERDGDGLGWVVLN